MKVDTLPNTGIGEDEIATDWLGAAALGAAAAYLAGRRIRHDGTPAIPIEDE